MYTRAKLRDEVLGPGFLHAGVFHEVQNFGDGGFAKFLGGLNLQQAGDVDTAADDLVPGLDVPGQALAGEGGSVQGRSALQNDAVNGDALAGLDHDGGADLDLIRVYLLQLAVLALDIGVVRADVHQAGNALAALAHGHALEQLADLIEDDNGAALNVIAQGKGTHGGNRHQEALVKGLAVLDALDGLAEHVPADHQIRDAVQRQLHRRGEAGQQFQNGYKDHRCDDLLEHFLLFFVHLSLSFCADLGTGFQGGVFVRFHLFSTVSGLFHVFPRLFHRLFPTKRGCLASLFALFRKKC